MIKIEKIGQGTYFEDAFKLSFKYNPVTVTKIKELAQRRYLPGDRAWEIPSHELTNLIEKVGINNITADAALLEVFKTKEIEDKRAATQERLRGIKPIVDFDFTTDPLPHQIEAFNYGMERNALLIGDEQGLGKAVTLDTKIITPYGFEYMRDIHVGDYVIGANGEPTKVIAEYPQGEKEIYRVTFSDGSTVNCCKEHLWGVFTNNDRRRNKKELRVLSLEEIMQSYKTKYNYKYYIPMTAPVRFIPRNVKIPPYTLGALLGDGYLENSCVSITTNDAEIIELMNCELGVSYFKKVSSVDNRYDCILPNRTLGKYLKEYGLIGCRSEAKFIPEDYLYNEVNVRVDVLSGLLDTDGYIMNCGTYQYYTVSDKLCEGVTFLVNSLGGKVKGRTEYQRLLADMNEDKFDIIVIKSQDRLQRNTKDWYIFADHLNKTDKRLFLYMDNKFFVPAEDALITGIKAILAEEYSRDLSKKLNNANKRRIEKARNGEAVSAMGNSQMYGYRIVNGKWVIEPEEAKIVRKMYELYLELHSIRKVRNALNELGYRNKAEKLFTDEAVCRVIRNEKHKGWVILNRYHRNFETKKIIENPSKEWVIVKNDHEPIVSEELWDTVNHEIDSHRNKGNNKGRGKRIGTDPLSGKLFCNCCGRLLWKHATKGTYKGKNKESTYKTYSQWICSSKMCRGELACEDPSTISGVQLNKYLFELADQFLDYSTIEYSKNLLKKKTLGWLQDLKEQLATPTKNGKIEAEISKLEAKKSKLIDLYTDDLITKEDFVVKSKQLDDKLEEKRALLVPVEENPDIKVIDDTIATIDAEIEALFEDEAMVEEKKIQFITEHIKKIVVFSNKDVFIVLDSIAGAFLFVDKGNARLDIVPVEAYNPEELSEVAITENEIIPFDRESMSLAHGGVCYEIYFREGRA